MPELYIYLFHDCGGEETGWLMVDRLDSSIGSSSCADGGLCVVLSSSASTADGYDMKCSVVQPAAWVMMVLQWNSSCRSSILGVTPG